MEEENNSLKIKLIKENSNSEGNKEELEESDKYCFNKNNGIQITGIKFPSFDDDFIEIQLREEITINHLNENVNSIIELMVCFENNIINILTSGQKSEIIEIFARYGFNYIKFIAYSVLSRRQITLIFFLIKLDYDRSDKNLKKIIENNYKNVKVEKLLEEFVQMISPIEIKRQVEKFNEITNLFLNNLENELIICDHDHKPSLVCVNVAILYFKSVIESIINDLKKLHNNQKEDLIIDFMYSLSKLETINYFLSIISKLPDDDIFNYAETSKPWIKLKQHIERKILFSKYTMNKKLQHLFDYVILGNASISKGDKFQDNYSKFFGTGWYMAYFFFNKKEAIIQSKKLFINPSAEIARKVWNLVDTKGIKNLYKLALPSIKYRKKLYFRRNLPEVNLGFISDMLFKLEEKKWDCSYKLQLGYASRLTKDSIISKEKSNKGENLLDAANNLNNYVKVKLLFSRDFLIPKFKSKWKISSCCHPERNYTRNSLIIHIHGGGFVAMSSSSHENYLRKWVNDLNVPLISIDYRLSPDHVYPAALDDCWQAYNWIIDHALEELDIELNKIILIGDSSGGNLSLGITYLCILNNKRVPNALFLVYPALRMDFRFYTPSSLLCIDNIIVPFHLLKYCSLSYIGEYSNYKDPFINPIMMNSEVIKKLPYTRIFGGSSDPFRDEFIRFTQILIDNEVNCKYTEFKYFPHGFLNYDVPILIPEVGKVNQIISNEMHSFLENN